MEFQWYPGHMTKAVRAMQEDIKLIDVVIELVDSRIPLSSKNPDIDKIANNKSRVILFNKVDLADSQVTELWTEYYKNKGFYVVEGNSKTGQGLKDINGAINAACKEKIERNKRRGILNRPMRAMIVGIPNVGKSTFINSIAGKACAKTGNKPGVTKGKQWIRLNKNIELLDTPGILWPKFEDQLIGRNLAFTGSIKDDLYNIYELTILLLEYLLDNYEDLLYSFYMFDNNLNGGESDGQKPKPYELLEQLAVKRGFLLSGGKYDLEKAAFTILDDFRKGRIGHISLERPM